MRRLTAYILGLSMRYPKYMQCFRRRRELLSQDPNSSRQDTSILMARVEKGSANHADGSNHIWMQNAEALILACFFNGILKYCSWSRYAEVKPAIGCCFLTRRSSV